MRVHIEDEVVRKNIELFLKIMQRIQLKEAREPLPIDKVFKAWVNRDSGQFSFAEEGKASSTHEKKTWKAVQLCYQYDSKIGALSFFVDEEGDGQKKSFECADLAPVAMLIMQQTMRIFQEITERLKGPSDLATKISVLSKMIIDAGVPHEDRNILIDAWHPADRMQAESMLINKPVGTYLFRRDEYAEMLEEQLKEQLGKKVKCFTLTFLGAEGKISDLTLVHSDAAWQVYNDDPSLLQKRFVDLQGVIAHFRTKLKYPFYH